MWIGMVTVADSGLEGHMSWTGMGGMALWGAVVVGILLMAAFFGSWLGREGRSQRSSALEVLETRFASGEIDEEEFVRRRGLLGSEYPTSR